MPNLTRRNFLKVALGSAIVISTPFTLTNPKIVKEEVIYSSYTFGQKALAYGLSTGEIISSYLAIGGIWIADVLLALLAFMVLICSVIVTAILV